jgi:hypothetical protein
MKRRLLAVVLGLTLSLALSAPALAHVCSNQNKNPYAGAIGVVTIDVVTGEETFEPLNDNGNFIVIVAVFPDGSEHVFSIYLHATPEGALPDVARNAGPGNDYCDYRGVDDAEACFEALIAAISQ